ncbi:MAG: hypothetical protein VX764_07025 [Planctomycetota bacterium]|nr:hypothetical protein [Planctomycetota bacterium]
MTREPKLLRKTGPFIATVFCFYIVRQEINAGSDAAGDLIPFLSFLPMCFMFMGFSMMAQDNRIQKLEAEKDERQVETE